MSKEYTGKKGFNVVNSEHFGIQRKIVSNMTSESWETIPHVSCVLEPDVTEFMDEYKKLNASGRHADKITINTIVLRIIVEGIKVCPAVNAHIDFNRRLVKGYIEQYSDINISMPMVLPDGQMMTINLHNFEDKTLDEMTAYIADVNRRLKNTKMTEAMFEVSLDNTLTGLKKLKLITTFGRLAGAKLGKHRVVTLKGKAKKEYLKIPETDRITKKDIEQGTITVSNFGSIYKGPGITTLLDVIPPQVLVVGICPLQEKPGVYTDENGEKQIGIRKYMPLCISFDHRALDFGEIVPFMKKIEEIFANPSVIQNW